MSKACTNKRSKFFQPGKYVTPPLSGLRMSMAAHRLILIWAIALMIPFLLTGCGGGGSTSDYWGGGSDTSLTSLIIDPATATIPLGKSAQFTALAVSSDGSTYNVTDSVTWSSSGENTATVSSAGLVTAKGAGQATITATRGTMKSQASVTVTTATLKSIAVSPVNPTVPVGRRLQLTAMGTFDDGSVLDLSDTVAWTSSSTATATVNAQGIVTVTGQGSATITAAENNISGTTTITASPGSVTLVSINVDPDNPTMRPGDRLQFKAIGTFSDGTSHELTSTLTWTSSETQVAFIAEDGLCTALAHGTSTITAIDLDDPKITGTSTLTVSTSAVKSIAVTPATCTLPAGRNVQLKAIATYEDGKTDDVTATAAWKSSNTAAVTVDAKGLVTAPAAGTGSSTVTATLEGKSGSSAITVNSGVTLVSLAVNPSNPTIQVGHTQQFTATGTFSDGSTHDVTRDCTWTSSDTKVATITSPAGLATAVAQGSTDITAADGAISDKSTLTVGGASKLVSIAVTPDPAAAAFGQTVQFTATGTYENKSTRDLTKEVTWASSDHAIADFSNDAGSEGKATAKNQAGSTDITATTKDKTVTSKAVKLTVSGEKGNLVSIAVYSTDNGMKTGESLTYKASGYYDNNTARDISSEVTWTSSDPKVATIDQKTGVAKAVSTATAATTVITATPSSGGAVTGAVTLVVNPAPSSASVEMTIVNNSGVPDEAVFLLNWGQERSSSNFYYSPFCRTATTVLFYSNQQTVGTQYSYPLVGLKKGDKPHTYTFPFSKDNMFQGRVNVSLRVPLSAGPASDAQNMVQPGTAEVVPWDFFEANIQTNPTGTWIINFDTSNVDFFSLGLQASWKAGSTEGTVGFVENARNKVVDAFAADPVFKECLAKQGSMTAKVFAPYNVGSPGNTLNTWLDGAIKNAWDKYKGPGNTNIPKDGWIYGDFVYKADPDTTLPADTINILSTSATYGNAKFQFAKPTTMQAFQQHVSGEAGERNLQALIYSALSRGVCETYTDWGSPISPNYGYPDRYYKSTTVNYNNYAEILHRFSLPAKGTRNYGTGHGTTNPCYAIAADDHYNQDPDSGDLTFSEVQAITLTIPSFDLNK